MEEEDLAILDDNGDYQTLPICTCVCDDIVTEPITPSEQTPIPERKQLILSTVARTESYLRERRIPELIRFLLTMILAHTPDNPKSFLEKLLNDCMLFRAGHGLAPVLYENRHLEAVIKSFDPGQRGWLSAGQVHRLYTTLGLNIEELTLKNDEKIQCDVLLDTLKKTQEVELFQLLAAGVVDNKNNEFPYD
ncbi:uncharacterized protein LOC123876305 [Maniola jurtina]|uniref:uncharacterized protein LOC123876305 n=1 Tax=Maniola jurtina TaxID=191418 RepID=UPI001E6897C4|nr:uncharacterized protein LOC123876305 [Maniola jurtina]